MKNNTVVKALLKKNMVLQARIEALAKQNVELRKVMDAFMLEQSKNRTSWYSVTYKPLEDR